MSITNPITSVRLEVLSTIKEHPELWLTVGQLKAILEKNAGIPDNTPVLYQRIEDTYFDTSIDKGWRLTLLPWERHDWTQELEDWFMASRSPFHLIEEEGKRYIQELSSYIKAHSLYLTSDEQGTLAICIHAHY